MKRKHLKKRIGSLVLAAAMIITSFPVLSTEVQAAEVRSAVPGQFVTKEQLKTFNTDDTDDAGKNPAKVSFGQNGSNAQEWWIAGCQGGDSVTLFAASPLVMSQMFNENNPDIQTKTYSADWDCKYPDGTRMENQEVYINHYGASLLRAALKEWETSTSYFSTAEQALMQETTIYTNDAKNSTNDTKTDCAYSTTDKLYLAYGEGEDTYITVGENAAVDLNNGLRIEQGYWGIKNIWLRTPVEFSYFARVAYPKTYVAAYFLESGYAVVPAFELNLSSVLFASAAKAASSETANGTIADDAAMILRLDGADKTIGTVSYDVSAGKIVAQKAAGAAGTVSLVVQGNDGTEDWYYSVKAGKTTVVTKEQIKTACGLSGDINLADCKIWMETTIDNLAYARMAEAKTIKMINTVALTGVKPAGGSAFPAKASCSTEGIDANSLAITYTAKDTSATAMGTAEWNTAYQAGLTLAVDNSDSMVYLFGDSVSVTVDGETAQNVKLNEDGTLTATKDFTIAKRRITGVSIPTVPSSKVFANYYTAENVLSNTNSELGRQTTLTLEGSASPNTKSVDVVWALANSGSAAYNATPGAGNTFRWTIAAAQIKDYDASGCTGYDSGTGTISGTVAISNKAGTPVTITGSNQTLNFDGSTIDVSQYFTIDANAGTETYSLVSGTGVTGQGSLSGAVLTVTKPGVFQVKLTTAVNGNYAAGEKTITLTVNYSSGEVTLESGKTVVREDETVKNDSNGTVTIDKGNDGTVDVTVKLPQAGSVNIDAEGKVTVPANGTVQTGDGKELTLPEGGTVDKDGNVEAEKIKGGDITVTAPSGEKVKADKAGKITVPAGGTVQTGDGKEITLPEGGTVDKDGNVESRKITIGDIMVTAPDGEKVTADKAGTITVPAGGKVETGDGKVTTLPDGGTVDKDGNVNAGKITVGDITVTLPEGGKVETDEVGTITVPAGGMVQTGDGATITLPSGGTVDKDGTVEGGKITVGETTVTAPEGGKVTADKAGTITVPAEGTVQNGDGEEITLPGGGTVDTAGTLEAEKITVGETTVTAPEGGKVTVDNAGTITVPAEGTVQNGDGEEITLPNGGSVDTAGTITVPAEGTVQTGDGVAITLPSGGTVDKDGNVEAGKITVGETTVTAPEGGKVTADKAGTITVPAGGKVETEDGKVTTLPDGGTVDKDGNVKARKITVGNTTITLPEGGKVETDEAGTITVPAGGTVQTGDGAAITLPEGGTVDKDGNVEAGKITVGNTTVTAPEGGKVTADKAGTITVPAGGTVQTGDGKELTLPNGGTVDKDENIEAEKITSGETTVTAPEGGKVVADKAGKITIPAGGKVQTGDGKEITLPNGGTVDKNGNVEAAKTDAEKVEAAKSAVKEALAGITATNETTKEDIQSVINTALTKAEISDVTVTVGDLSKTEATTSVAGRISGSITITSGSETDNVEIDKSINKLPATGNTGNTENTGNTGNTGNLTDEQKALCQTIEKELGVSEETAVKILALEEELGVPEETLLMEDSTFASWQSEGDIKGSTFSRLQAKQSKVTAKSVKLTWKKVKGADGYEVYAARCGKANKLKRVKTIENGNTKTYTQKKLKKGKAYKYVVRAYKMIDGKKVTIAASKTIHVSTSGGKYGNVKSVKVKKAKVSLKKGKTFKIKASEVKEKKKLKKHRKLCYESSNTKVATVTKKGQIKAKAKGTCTIYVYAQNGKMKTIKVTVK